MQTYHTAILTKRKKVMKNYLVLDLTRDFPGQTETRIKLVFTGFFLRFVLLQRLKS